MSPGPSEPESGPGPKVFITYRREETGPHAGRLYDAMVARFGEDNVFMDVDMALGVDFVERITEAVAACQVLIVVMGPRWATVEDEKGTQRIADPEDFVRLEVSTGLRRQGVTVIPVLIAGARMPEPEGLPEDLRALTRRNALEMGDLRWRYDVGRLMTTIEQLLAPPATTPPAAAQAARPPRWRRRPVAALLGALAFLAVAATVLILRGSDNPDATTTGTSKPRAIEVAKPGETPRPVRVTVAEPGQRSTFTFSGTEGERVVPDVRDVTVPASISIVDPADETVINDWEFKDSELLRTDRCGTAEGCQPVTLKRDGKYTVEVEGDAGSGTGSLVLRLYEVDPNLHKRAEIGGPPVAITLGVGQSASVEFQASEPGARVTFRLIDIDLTEGIADLRDPRGKLLVKQRTFSAGESSFSRTLALRGTYTAYFRGNDLASGSFKVELTQP